MSGLRWSKAEEDIRNVHWVIEWQGVRAKTPRRIEHHLPGADALRAVPAVVAYLREHEVTFPKEQG